MEHTYPKIPVGHPRVFVNRDTLAGVAARLAHPANTKAKEKYESYLAEPPEVKLGEPGGRFNSNTDSHFLTRASCYALAYLLEGDERRGRDAIESMLSYHAQVIHGDYNSEGQEVFTLGLIYDWCYPLLRDEEKAQFYDAVTATAGIMEMGYPVFKQGLLTGHGVEGQLMRDFCVAAVAMADEYPDLYAYAAPLFFDKMVPGKKLFYDCGMYPQGTHYIAYRMQWEFLATALWENLGFPRVFGDKQKDPLYWFLYMRRPDGNTFYDGDGSKNNNRHLQYYSGIYRSYFHAARLFADPYLRHEANREEPSAFYESTNQTVDVVEHLLFSEPGATEKPFDDLPLTRYFGGIKGEMIARTGWGDGQNADTAVVQMKINEIHTVNHQHLDGGAFQIYYKGYLATDSGYYQAYRSKERTPDCGNTNYGAPHFYNYYQRTVAHNCLCVKDPEETFCFRGNLSANDGGQRYPNDGKEPIDAEYLMNPENGYRVGTVLAHAFGPDVKTPHFSYLKGNLSAAYTKKIEDYERSFCFLNIGKAGVAGALLIFDRVRVANPAFPKSWLLHTLGEPTVTDNGIVARDPREGYEGALSLTALLPVADKRDLRVVGGAGREHEVDGVNYLGKALEGDHWNEGGGYRTEIVAAGEKETRFLNVLQIKDATAADCPVALAETDTHVGARLDDTLVLFGKAGESSVATFETTVGERVCLLDLQPGDWDVDGTAYTVGAEEKMLYLTLPAGKHAARRV